MHVAPCKYALYLAMLLLGGICQATADTTPTDSCLAVLKYSAIAGDPAKAKNSEMFRGFVRVEDQLAGWKPRDSKISWTFTKGETISGGENVVRDSREEGVEAADVSISSFTTANTQSVEMEYFAEGEVVEIGFIASKGLTSNSSGGFDTRSLVGLPDSFIYDGIRCKEPPNQMDQQFQSTEDDAELSKDNSILELEYLPLEFTNMQFGAGYASNFAIFAFRLSNNGTTPIDLADVELEYWFDGGSGQDEIPEIVFNSECMTATVTDCNQFKVSVQPGLEKVSGAHYKVVIGFGMNAGRLTPQKTTPPPIDESLSEKGPTMIEAIINITSAQFFAQIDVTKDYSFLNTTILDEEHNLPDELVPRQYELNPRMPVFMNGKIVFGNRPKASLQKVELSLNSNQNQCWLNQRGIQECGMRAKYCCNEPVTPEDNTSSDKLLEWEWIVGLAVSVPILAILCILITFYYFRMRNNANREDSLALVPRKRGSSAGNPRINPGFDASAAQLERSGSTPRFTMTSNPAHNIDVRIDYEKDIEPYLSSLLGRGGYGEVHQGTYKGVDVAVKVQVQKHGIVDTVEKFKEEIRIASKMDHDNIVRVLGASLEDKNKVCLIMELVDGGSLSTRIHDENEPPLEYIEVLKIGLDIANALKYMHPRVVHRDLKPSNVLLTKDGSCKIADFEISKVKDPHKNLVTVSHALGTCCYMAPEVLEDTKLNGMCDIYSLGCILNEAMGRKVPFSDRSPKISNFPQLFNIVVKLKERPKLAEGSPPELVGLIESCWEENLESRPSAKYLVGKFQEMIEVEMRKLSTPPEGESQASSSRTAGK